MFWRLKIQIYFMFSYRIQTFWDIYAKTDSKI